ncbi:DHH family phosphoesterase [Archaeoglobus profundus]|uniref:TrkA-N domain protein n=1 Tax=Archaeoglobus profundus (strain DSM 5631 / JCM 9629 / NBRC 100127 / Av18) TaxID=572546 RepID=D2RFM9_ARCPA|nr:DHH family phosphoesterase [Archaeoglobus profundus]ADB57104.1 TrkA-N domain protein [Archaeoglobus profundus DSM 5631]
MEEKFSHEYIVIGCGATGFSVVKELVRKGKKVLAIDISKERVEVLRDENYDAIVGDATDESLYQDIDFSKVSIVMVLTSDTEANKRAVEIVRSISKDVFIIARSQSSKTKEELEQAGADFVVVPSEAMKTIVLEVIRKADTYRKLKLLAKVIESCRGRLGIFTHDNPDPDAISSALALKEIARYYGVEADILYYGDIMHQENRAMVNLLEIEMLKADEVDLSIYDKFAIVDCSKPGVNNSIPQNIHISIVIDHHPAEDVMADFVDIRTDVGACATILTEYLKEMRITPSRTLATALFFGIKTETNNFKKNTRTADFLAAAFLYPFVDHELIEKMEGPAISTETLDVLATAIKNRQVYSSFLISFAGYITNRDVLPQAADFLLRLEGISTVLVFGILKDKVYISARNKDVRINIGEVLKRAFGDVGSAGGHAHSGGAQIPLGIFGEVTDRDALAKLVTEAIKKRFLNALGVEVKE